MSFAVKGSQASLPGFCPIEAAVATMAGAGIEERGAVFTRREVVDFILDLVGYTADKPLHEARILERYNILCQKLTKENLYTSATLLASPKTAAETGEHCELSELTGLKTFVTTFAGHIAAEAARQAM
ncbi:PaeR7I family type II restriction endonuclease [Bradyrhizobium tunisiense]|uniref:PaeR7I family type II restriction endonuclease n=1 Tax=Bradyrhizobium tunisiense TaxID=3278709 RepID=UPI0035DA00C5